MVGPRGLLVAISVGLASGAVVVYRDLPTSQWLPDLLVGLAALVLVATTWRASIPTSVLALLVAATWWAGTLWPVALYWHRAALLLLVLSAPAAWPRSRWGRWAVAAGFVAAVTTPLWQLGWFGLVAAVTVVAAGVVESRARLHPRRHLLAPVLLGSAIAGGVLAPHVLGTTDGPPTALIWYDGLLLALLAVIALVARSPSRIELTDLAVDLGSEPVRDVDALMELVRAEPGLATDADLQGALAAARRMEDANAEVRQQLSAAVDDVDRSRRRLVVAAAQERRRLADELGRTIAVPLHALAARASGTRVAAPALARAAESLEAAMLGLRPRGLAHGLAIALHEHPLVASLGVTLDVADQRCDDVVEDALYASAAEALTNVAKYAGRCRVTIRFAVAGSEARLTVADDGPGGAVPGKGSGLAGLTDRLEALGGGLDVVSAAGTGTMVTAWAPQVLTEGAPHRPSEVSTPAEP